MSRCILGALGALGIVKPKVVTSKRGQRVRLHATSGESSGQLVARSLLLWLAEMPVSCRKILGLVSFFQQVLVFDESSPLIKNTTI